MYKRRERRKVPKKKKMGRPTIDGKSQDFRIGIRIDNETLEKLDRLAEEKKMNRSEYIRQLIKKAK